MNKTIIKTLNELKEYAPCFNWGVFSFDTETTGLDYYTLELEGMSFCDGKNAFYIDLIDNPDFNMIIAYIHELFKSNHILICHNIVFDLKVLQKYGIVPKRGLYCTMVADHLINENRRHGLKSLVEELFGYDTISYKKVANKDRSSEGFYDYALNDAIWTWELMCYQKPLLTERDLLPLFKDIEMPFQRVIVEMETIGITMDKAEIGKVTEELNTAILDFKLSMLETLGEKYSLQADLFGNKLDLISKINFNSLIDLRKILFEDLKLPIIEYTPTGKSCVGRVTLDKLYGKHPFVDILYKYKVAQKLLSSFFRPMPNFIDGDNKIRPSFHDTGTATGRLSCSSPNLQQLPAQNNRFPINTRGCFIVPPEHKMITCDYSGQEIRVMAEISKDSTLVDSLIKGQDMHLRIANQFYNLNIPDECLYTTHKEYKKYKKKFKSERTKAKCITFGLCYGKSAFGFAKDFDISEDEAQKIVDKYFEGMPQLRAAISGVKQQIKDTGIVTTMFGRQRHFQKIEKNGWVGYPNMAYRQGFNFLIQSASADMIRTALVKVYNESKKHPNWNLKCIATVHDELVAQVREEYAEEASKLIKECFESAIKFCVPIIADVQIGCDYGDSK